MLRTGNECAKAVRVVADEVIVIDISDLARNLCGETCNCATAHQWKGLYCRFRSTEEEIPYSGIGSVCANKQISCRFCAIIELRRDLSTFLLALYAA